MAHIHTEPGQFDQTVSAFIIRTDFPEPKILLHLHKKIHRYLQFGGHIELDESPWQAIIHEVREESGYTMGQLQLLQPKQRIRSLTNCQLHPIPFYYNSHVMKDAHKHLHTDIGYAFITGQEPDSGRGTTESNEMLLLSRQELAGLPANKTLESVREAGLFVFDVCLPEWVVADQSDFA